MSKGLLHHGPLQVSFLHGSGALGSGAGNQHRPVRATDNQLNVIQTRDLTLCTQELKSKHKTKGLSASRNFGKTNVCGTQGKTVSASHRQQAAHGSSVGHVSFGCFESRWCSATDVCSWSSVICKTCYHGSRVKDVPTETRHDKSPRARQTTC